MSDAIPFVFRKFSMLVDGTIRMIVDVEPNDAHGVFKMFHEPDVAGAMVRLSGAAASQIGAHKSAYGDQARELRLSGFFRCQSVWPKIGTDKHFLGWLKAQKCCVCGKPGPGDPAHVRRIASGAGTGRKPEYSAVPMCHEHHVLQHQQGESAVGGKEFLDKARVNAVESWSWTKLKSDLGIESWKDAEPGILAQWAKDNDVFQFLPDCYKEAI